MSEADTAAYARRKTRDDDRAFAAQARADAHQQASVAIQARDRAEQQQVNAEVLGHPHADARETASLPASSETSRSCRTCGSAQS